jgi:spore maturation protein CgeB
VKAILCHPGPQFSVADVYNGLVKGLNQNGVQVGEFNLNDRLNFYTAACVRQDGEYRQAMEYKDACRQAAKGLLVHCYEWDPDVVIVTSGMFLPPDLYATMRRHRVHTVLWCTESPYEDDTQIAQAGLVDTVIVNDPTNIERFRAYNPRTWYIPHSYDPDIHTPTGTRRRERPYDFGFVGTGYQSRIDFFEKVDWTGIDAVLAGHWRNIDYQSPIRPLLADEPDQCIDNTDAVQLYRSSLVSANLYRKEAQGAHLVDGWAMGPREVELAACRTFTLREPRGEGDELLWMLPTFTEPAELGDMVRWWSHRDRDEQRKHLAAFAAEAVAQRTFQNHAAQLLRHISS